jgi:hypothetical protein
VIVASLVSNVMALMERRPSRGMLSVCRTNGSQGHHARRKVDLFCGSVLRLMEALRLRV